MGRLGPIRSLKEWAGWSLAFGRSPEGRQPRSAIRSAQCVVRGAIERVWLRPSGLGLQDCPDGAPRTAANAILSASIGAGIIEVMSRKITGHVPEDLLERARRSTGKGVTDTVRQGLSLVAAGDTYRQLAQLRGTVRFSKTARQLRDDRR